MKKTLLITFFTFFTFLVYAQESKDFQITCTNSSKELMKCADQNLMQFNCTKNANGSLSCHEKNTSNSKIIEKQKNNSENNNPILSILGLLLIGLILTKLVFNDSLI